MPEATVANIHELSHLFHYSESLVIAAVAWLRLVVETMGAIVIGAGIVVATQRFIYMMIRKGHENFHTIRLTLARYLALALELQLGADILSTAIAPTWDQIGKLGAIAVIRTALNYFLSHEMEVSRREMREDEESNPHA